MNTDNRRCEMCNRELMHKNFKKKRYCRSCSYKVMKIQSKLVNKYYRYKQKLLKELIKVITDGKEKEKKM